MRHLQFVNWFPKWRGLYCFRWHKEKSDLAYIYDWFFAIAFWELRKWHKLTDEDKKALAPSSRGSTDSYTELKGV